MSDGSDEIARRAEIEHQIRSKELEVERLRAELREARAYISGLRRQLEGRKPAKRPDKDARAAKTTETPATPKP